MDKKSDDMTIEIYCSGCHQPIGQDEHQYPLAHRKYICPRCYKACGFTANTATNCLSEEDIRYMLALKEEYPEDGPVVEYDYFRPEPGKAETSQDDMVLDSEDENLGKTDHDSVLETTVTTGVEEAIVEKTIEIPNLRAKLPPDNDVEMPVIQEPISDTPSKKKMAGLPFVKKTLVRKEEPLGDIEVNTIPEPELPPVNKGISARKYEESRYRTEDDYPEETDPTQRKKNIIKIVAIIAVTLVTILVVGSFLPFSAFSGNGNVDTFTITQGEENFYSQKPLVPKDGYIYNVPAGDYTVTMTEDSTAARGVVTIEGNTVLPSSTGIGYYENLETIELTPGESAEVSLEDGQHIYTSINSVFTFEQQ